MLYKYPPEWSRKVDEYTGEIDLEMTKIWDPAYQSICKDGKYREYIEGNGMEYLPVHDLLQNIFQDDPKKRISTDQILMHDWFQMQ